MTEYRSPTNRRPMSITSSDVPKDGTISKRIASQISLHGGRGISDTLRSNLSTTLFSASRAARVPWPSRAYEMVGSGSLLRTQRNAEANFVVDLSFAET